MALNGSWQQQVLCTATADTIADGITVCEPIPQALDDLQGLVDAVLLVSDWHPLQAMQRERPGVPPCLPEIGA